MKFFRLGLLFLIVTVAGTGCTQYSANRCRDFADMFTMNFSFGLGLDVNVQAGRFTQVGLGTYGDDMYRGLLGTYKIGFVGRQGGFWAESKYDINFLVPIWGYTYRKAIWGDIQDKNAILQPPPWYPAYKDKNRGLWAIGGNAHVVLLGLEVYFDPAEAGDFLLGIFTVDLAQDDVGPPDMDQFQMGNPTIRAPEEPGEPESRPEYDPSRQEEREIRELDPFRKNRRK